MKTKIENDVRLEDYFPKFKDWKRQRSHLNNYEQAKTFIREEFMVIIYFLFHTFKTRFKVLPADFG